MPLFSPVHAKTWIMVCPLAVRALKRISGRFLGTMARGAGGLLAENRGTLGRLLGGMLAQNVHVLGSRIGELFMKFVK